MSSSDPNGIFGLSYDYYADLQYYFGLLETLAPDYTPAEHGIAIFLLVLCSVLLVVFSGVMVLFFLKRNVFEIRARSPFLVMLTGACFMAVLAMSIMLQMVVVFDYTLDAVQHFFMSYFILACATSCYGSRTIRLAVMFNARARKAVPWLMSERNHVIMCLLLGVAAMGFPLYDLYDIPDGPFAELVFYVRSNAKLWRVLVVTQAVVLALWIFNRKTDDMFNIAGELRLAMASQLLVSVAGKLAEDHLDAPYNRWFGPANWGLVLAVILFSFSVANPLRQLLYSPLESSDPKVAQALVKRKEGGGILATRDCEVSTVSTMAVDDDIAGDLADSSNVIWTYEKVAKNPQVSAAFDEFSRKALCQESVLFLKAVTSYQNRGDGGWAAPAGGSSGGSTDDKYEVFKQIVHSYIMNGAPDEVNLSSEDKSEIFDVHEAGRSGFGGLHPRERRFVFARAYAEVRYVLESNLMKRFVSSDGFKEAAQVTGTVI